MNTEQVISTLETAQASAPAMDSQILSMKSVENTKTMGTAAKSFSIPLPHKIEDETKMTNNLSHNFPETLREASRSAESPPLHEQEKLEKQESLSEIDKNTNLETTVVTEKNLGELHDVEDFKRQSTIALDQVSGELQSVSEPVMLQDNRKVEQETKDAPINLKEVNMERSVMHDETTVTLKEIEPKESIEMADVSFEVKGRTPARRTSTKKMHSNAKNPPNFVYETNIPAGSIVFAQLKGFPKWPAMVLEPTDIPEVHLPKKLGMNLYCVMFYGSYQYGFPRDRDVIPFSPNVENVLSVAPKKLQIQAIKEAQTNPMIIYEKNKEYLENQKYLATSNELQDEETVMVSGGGGGRRRNAHEEEEDDDEEEVGEEDEEYHEVTPKRNNRRHPPLSSSLPKHRDVDTKKNTSRHSSPTTSSTNITTTTTTTTTTTPSQKKRRLSALPSEEVTPTSKRIKHRSTISNRHEPSLTSSASSKQISSTGAVYTKSASASAHAPRADASKYVEDPIFESLMRLRHTLQRTFIQDKHKDKKPRASAKTLHTLEWHLINGALDELGRYLQHADFDADLFKATKLPKVLHLVSAGNYEPVVEEKMREHRILHRVAELLDTIKSLLPPPSVPSQPHPIVERPQQAT